MRFYRNSLAVAVSLALTACGGGGGGGGGPPGTSSSLGAFIRSEVPYYTPVRVDDFKPLSGQTWQSPITTIYAQDLNGDSSQEVVVQTVGWGGDQAGWQNSALQVYGWNSGNFANETSTWFAGNDNVNVGGTTVKFGDFRGVSRVDMFVAGFTDSLNYYAPSTVYFNNGNNTFSRVSLNFGEVNPHDSIVVDLNGDGFSDIFVTDIGNQRPAVAFGSATGDFTVYRSDLFGGGAGISAADYLGNGSLTVILTDAPRTVVGNQLHDTKLYSWQIQAGKLVLTELSTLPPDRFYLSKWDDVRAANVISPHAVRNISLDFDGDGLTDVIVFSTLEGRALTNGYSEVQFLRNDGGGNFTDVTDTVLVGYDNFRSVTYNPVLLDINRDGLMDILLSEPNYGINNDRNTTVLLQTQEGKFVESYTSVFQDFTNQIRTATPNGTTVQPISVVRGPGDNLYLFSTVQYEQDGVARLGSYLSLIGTAGTADAAATIANLQQVWPWLSPAQANEILARTAVSFIDGVAVIDPDRMWNPIGGLGININGERWLLNGHVSVPGLDRNRLNDVTATDAMGRDYRVDLGVMDLKMPSLTVDRFVSSQNITQNWSSRFVDDITVENQGFSFTGRDNSRFASSVNTRALGLSQDWDVSLGLARMPGSPWMSFSGIFGSIEDSVMVELNSTQRWQNGMFAQGGVMQTTTNFRPGLITNITPLWSGYAMAGWQDQNWSVYGGLQPTIFSGKMDLDLPTKVDSRGRISYTSYSVPVRNEPVFFVGTQSRWKKQNHSLIWSAAMNDTGSYRMQLNYRQEF